MQNSVDAGVAIELQAQAWQTASWIEADGAIEADRKLEHRTRAIGAIGRQGEPGDLGDVRHWGDIYRDGYRCAGGEPIVCSVVTGHHREGSEAIAVDISGGCPIGVGVARDGVIAAGDPGRCGFGAAAQAQAAAGDGLHHIGSHLTIDIAGIGHASQGLETDLCSSVFLGAHHTSAQTGEGGCIVHRGDRERASGHGTSGLSVVADLPRDGAGGAGGGGILAAAGIGDSPQSPPCIQKGGLRSVWIAARCEGEGGGAGIPVGLHTGIDSGLGAQCQ